MMLFCHTVAISHSLDTYMWRVTVFFVIFLMSFRVYHHIIASLFVAPCHQWHRLSKTVQMTRSFAHPNSYAHTLRCDENGTEWSTLYEVGGKWQLKFRTWLFRAWLENVCARETRRSSRGQIDSALTPTDRRLKDYAVRSGQAKPAG